MDQPFRSHTCGELRKAHIGKTIILSGWVQRLRDLGHLLFIDLRDRYGMTQLVCDSEKNPEVHALAKTVHGEWVIRIEGTIQERETANPQMETGEIEVAVETLEILSQALPLPFSIDEEGGKVQEEVRLRHRALDLRRGPVLQNLLLRHQVTLAIRNFLDAQGFPEITTPILGKSTPEGARDYLVPSRIHPNHFYALPQSPQIFKQLLMIAGMDRYFQIAPCFRDEDLRADRQPEFTQVDLEMSFATRETLFSIIEEMMGLIFSSFGNTSLSPAFKRLSYKECMERYGTDKPDRRFGMELYTVEDLAKQSSCSIFLSALEQKGTIKGLCLPQGASLSRKEIEKYQTFLEPFGIRGLAWMKVEDEGTLQGGISKFFSQDLQQALIQRFQARVGDLFLFIADTPKKTNQALDHLRRKLAHDQDLIDRNHHEFLWVIDFPLLTWNEEEERMESEHHPFTSPIASDIPLLDKDPLQVCSSSYDLVLNGYELASGSERVYDSSLQQKIFQALEISEKEQTERFGFFLDALKYGTPPHLGIAFGLDRLVMILAQTEQIRDVIAFPKTQKASDLMLHAPSLVTNHQLKELFLETIDHQSTLV